MILIGTNIVGLILGLTMTFGVKSSLYWALAFHVVSLALSIQFYFVMNRYLVHQKFWDETKDEREQKLDEEFAKRRAEIDAKYSKATGDTNDAELEEERL